MPSMVWNYLRVRGEYSFRGKNVVSGLELPPRARRIRRGPREENRNAGTTSAYAENTSMMAIFSSITRNYLRVRGEYSSSTIFPRSHWELPPRTRRIRDKFRLSQTFNGTTSAYAENTISRAGILRTGGNYLRVRGEYWTALRAETLDGELPPRTRRIHASAVAVWSGCGTTSAYAENTLDITAKDEFAGNYLRVRGEYKPPASPARSSAELPPRTRRIRKSGVSA